MEPAATTRAPLLEPPSQSESKPWSRAPSVAPSEADASVHLGSLIDGDDTRYEVVYVPAQFGRVVATSTYLGAVTVCYLIAATFVSPQIIQADRVPWGLTEEGSYSYVYPTRGGGGYCYYPPCNSFNGVYKPPWFYNPSQDGHGAESAGVSSKHQIYVFSFFLFLAMLGVPALLELGSGADLDRPLPAKLGACLGMRSPPTFSGCLVLASMLGLVGVWLWQSYVDYLQPVYAEPAPPTHKVRKGKRSHLATKGAGSERGTALHARRPATPSP